MIDDAMHPSDAALQRAAVLSALVLFVAMVVAGAAVIVLGTRENAAQPGEAEPTKGEK